jgi:hypothetical protein
MTTIVDKMTAAEALAYLTPHKLTADTAPVVLTAGKMRAALAAITSATPAPSGAGEVAWRTGYLDGFDAAIRNLEVYTIRVTAEFDRQFDMIKEGLLTHLRDNSRRMRASTPPATPVASHPDHVAKLHVALMQARRDLVASGYVGAGEHGAGDPEINRIDAVLRDAPASPVVAEAWRPIETAPKDGQIIWAWLNQTGVHQVMWMTAEEVAEEEGGSPNDYDPTWVMAYDTSEPLWPKFWLPFDALPSPRRSTTPPATSDREG